MNLYVDCEFNGFDGPLISIGVVSDDGQEFYRALRCDKPEAWVAKNVLPVLNVAGLARLEDTRRALWEFLNRFPRVHVIADWPEDLKHFCGLLCVCGRMHKLPPISMALVQGLNPVSEVPHNALSDARALRDACKRV